MRRRGRISAVIHINRAGKRRKEEEAYMKDESDTWAKGHLVAECLHSRAMQSDDAAGDGVCRLFAVFNTVLA